MRVTGPAYPLSPSNKYPHNKPMNPPPLRGFLASPGQRTQTLDRRLPVAIAGISMIAVAGCAPPDKGHFHNSTKDPVKYYYEFWGTRCQFSQWCATPNRKANESGATYCFSIRTQAKWRLPGINSRTWADTFGERSSSSTAGVSVGTVTWTCITQCCSRQSACVGNRPRWAIACSPRWFGDFAPPVVFPQRCVSPLMCFTI